MLKYQTIAPAPSQQKKSSVIGGMICKTRKYTPRNNLTAIAISTATANSVMPSSASSSSSSSYNGSDQTQSVQRRNARERNRVKQVNNSFARLRQHIPQSIITNLTKGGGRGPHKKVSKVDTLRIAVEYIRRLQDLLDDLNGGNNDGGSRTTLSAAAIAAINDTLSNSSFISTASSCTTSISNTLSPAECTTAAATMTRTTITATTTGINEAITSCNNNNNNNNNNNDSTYQRLIEAPSSQHQQLYFPTSGLLTPVSLHSYSPPCLSQQENAVTPTAQSPTSPNSNFNQSGGCSYDSTNFDLQVVAASPLSPQSQQHQQQQNSRIASSIIVHHDHAIAHHQQHLLATQLQLKFEPYENFHLAEDDCTPDDEEILDYISLWEEQ